MGTRLSHYCISLAQCSVQKKREYTNSWLLGVGDVPFGSPSCCSSLSSDSPSTECLAALERMKERAARDAFTSDSSYFASDVNFDTLPYWEKGGVRLKWRGSGRERRQVGGKRYRNRRPNPWMTSQINKHKWLILIAASNVHQCHLREGPSPPGYTAASSSLKSEGQETGIIRHLL